jgi:membrane protein
MSLVGVTIMFALMFKFIPDAIAQWRDVWVGAAVTSVLFAVGKLLIGVYLGNGAIGSTFGAASSLVMIMLWAFYSAQIVLFGAEFTRLFATRFGSGIRPGVNALRVLAPAVESAVSPELHERAGPHLHRFTSDPRPWSRGK